MLATHWRPLLEGALDLICPRHCCLCSQLLAARSSAVMICPHCQERLLDDYQHSCSRCALPTSVYQTESRCSRCRGQRFAFGRATALGVYEGLLREAVIAGKRQDVLALSLGRFLAQQRRPPLCAGEYDYLVPMPMHWRRRLARGTNAAELLAESLRFELGVPLLSAIVCDRPTTKQGMLSRTARKSNVQGAFRPRRGVRRKLPGKRVLLVDDVMTTGATAHEAARTLRAAGAAEVHVTVVARGTGR